MGWGKRGERDGLGEERREGWVGGRGERGIGKGASRGWRRERVPAD